MAAAWVYSRIRNPRRRAGRRRWQQMAPDFRFGSFPASIVPHPKRDTISF
jgi:hypothetical protein